MTQLTRVDSQDGNPQITDLPAFSSVAGLGISISNMGGSGSAHVSLQQHVSNWRTIAAVDIQTGFTSGTFLATNVDGSHGALRVVVQTTGDLQAIVNVSTPTS